MKKFRSTLIYILILITTLTVQTISINQLRIEIYDQAKNQLKVVYENGKFNDHFDSAVSKEHCCHTPATVSKIVSKSTFVVSLINPQANDSLAINTLAVNSLEGKYMKPVFEGTGGFARMKELHVNSTNNLTMNVTYNCNNRRIERNELDEKGSVQVVLVADDGTISFEYLKVCAEGETVYSYDLSDFIIANIAFFDSVPRKQSDNYE